VRNKNDNFWSLTHDPKNLCFKLLWGALELPWKFGDDCSRRSQVTSDQTYIRTYRLTGHRNRIITKLLQNFYKIWLCHYSELTMFEWNDFLSHFTITYLSVCSSIWKPWLRDKSNAQDAACCDRSSWHLLVWHVASLRQNGWTDLGPAWDGNSWGPKADYILWESRSPYDGTQCSYM